MMELLKKIKQFVLTKHFLRHSGFIALTYVVIIGITLFYLDAYTNHGEKIRVPKLIGLQSSKAQVILEDLDLQMELLDSVYKPNLPAGTIVAQDPLPTSKSTVSVKEGRIIRVQVSKKYQLVEMPSLIDKSQRFAENVLKNRGLKFRIEYKPTNESNGAVLKQLRNGKVVKEGVKIPIGSVITIVVGRNEGGEPVEVPNLIGFTISEARGRLTGTSLNFLLGGCEGCTSSQDSSSAVIISQSPEYMEGTLSSPGTTVTVTASTSGNAPH